MTPLSKKSALIDSSLESSNFREHQTHVQWTQKVFHSVTLAGMMTFPACCQHIPGGRLGILVLVKPVSSIVLVWHCWDTILFTQATPNKASSIVRQQQIKEKRGRENSRNKRGNSSSFFLWTQTESSPRVYWLEQPGFLLFAECYRWLPGQEALPVLKRCSGECRGPGTSPLLPFQTSSPNPYWVKREREREREKEEEKKKPQTNACPWKHFCQSVF